MQHIVPRFEVTDILCKLAFVFGYDLLISNQNNPPGIGAQRDMAACIVGRNAVTIAAILNKASGRER